MSFYNKLRREAITQLELERVKHYPHLESCIFLNNELYPVTQLDYSANIANKKAEAFYRRHGVETIEPAFELQHEREELTIMTMKHCLRFQYGLCAGQVAVGCGPLFLYDTKNHYRLEFDCEACQMKIVLEKRSKGK